MNPANKAKLERAVDRANRVSNLGDKIAILRAVKLTGDDLEAERAVVFLCAKLAGM